MSTPEEFEKAHEAMLVAHGGEVIGAALKTASGALETGFVAGWNAALIAAGSAEALALVIRCEHGAALGVEDCPGEQKGTMQ